MEDADDIETLSAADRKFVSRLTSALLKNRLRMVALEGAIQLLLDSHSTSAWEGAAKHAQHLMQNKDANIANTPASSASLPVQAADC